MPFKPSVSTVVQGLAALGLSGGLKAGLRRRTGSQTVFKKKRRIKKRYAGRVPGGGSQTVTKRRRKVTERTSVEQKSRSLTVRARRPSAWKLAMAAMEPQWYRVQGLSNFDTTQGWFVCANRITQDGTIGLPVHVWDITASPNGVSQPQAGFYLNKSSAAPTASASHTALPTQNSDGLVDNTGVWQHENISETTDSAPNRKAFHCYTHIKANLYGVRQRATRYLVQLMMIKDELGDFISAGSTNLSKQKIYDYLARPFMFNNLNSGDVQVRNDIKILRSYEVIIDPISTDEYGGSTATPHIQTLNWFVNHNRVRHYDWKRDSPPYMNQDASWDQEDQAGHDIRVEPKHRLYLVIRAMSPSRRLLANNVMHGTAADPITEPSYDLVLRNKFLVPI